MDQKILITIIIFFSITNNYSNVIGKILMGLFYLIIVLYLLKNIYPDIHKYIIKLLINILHGNYYLSEIASFILDLFNFKPEEKYKFSKKNISHSLPKGSGSGSGSKSSLGLGSRSKSLQDTTLDDKYMHYNLMDSSVNPNVMRGQKEETLMGSIDFMPMEE
jgi:hypothetical protein